MALFESATEQGAAALSDEVLFADAVEETADQESNGSGSQGAENAETEISTEETSEQQVEVSAEEAGKEPVDKAAEQAAQSKRERDALAGMTKAMRDRADTLRELEEQKRQNAELQRKFEQMRIAVQQADPNKRKEALEMLTSNPMEFINNAAQPIIADEVARSVEAHLQPIREAEAKRAQIGEMAKAIQYLREKGYAQASDGAQLRELANTMTTLDPDWKNHPGSSLKLAALEAWGTPKVINQKLIDEAEERGKQKAIAEFNKRDMEKMKVPPVSTQTSAGKTEENTPEDEILLGIMSAGPTRLFQ